MDCPAIPKYLGVQNNNFVYVSMQNTNLLEDPIPTYLLMCGFVGSFYLLTGYETLEFLIFQLVFATITSWKHTCGFFGCFLGSGFFFKWKLRFLLSDMTEKTGALKKKSHWKEE